MKPLGCCRKHNGIKDEPTFILRVELLVDLYNDKYMILSQFLYIMVDTGFALIENNMIESGAYNG